MSQGLTLTCVDRSLVRANVLTYVAWADEKSKYHYLESIVIHAGGEPRERVLSGLHAVAPNCRSFDAKWCL